MSWLAQATQVSTSDVNKGYGNLVFMGCFFLALIIVAIFWLKRQV
ncbi:MAG TPA: hypothetical protein VHS31_02770 [Tepidisphaeraceae bacterium]|jgi:hypothetical protein|nr:hypothetical protein [Tepidisphaeraceae bacterium]